MNKAIKILLIPLILAAAVGLLSFYGCGGGGATQTGTAAAPGAPDGGSLSQQELEQILNDSVANYEELTTYRFDMDMDMITDIVGGTQSGKMTINTRSSGATVVATNDMQMDMEMSMSVEGIADQSGSQSITYGMYQQAGWIYINMDVPGMGSQWMKMPATEETESSFNMDSIDQQMGPLESPVKIEYLRSESVDGEDCYVLGITPDMKALAEWLGQQETGGTADWQDLLNHTDVFKEFNYICYVTREANYLKRMVVKMVMDFTAEQAGAASGDFDAMTMDISMDMTLYAQNQSITITLPDGAAGAVEVSEDMFSE